MIDEIDRIKLLLLHVADVVACAIIKRQQPTS